MDDEDEYEAEVDDIDDDEEDEEEDDEDEDEEGDEEGSDIDYDIEVKEPKGAINSVIKTINIVDNNHKIVNPIPKSEHKSSHIIQFTELVEAIGIRISQIERGSPVFTDVTGYTSPIAMSKKEFFDRKSPLKLVRSIESGDQKIEVEKWNVREMTFPISDREIMAITDDEMNKLLKNNIKK